MTADRQLIGSVSRRYTDLKAAHQRIVSSFQPGAWLRLNASLLFAEGGAARAPALRPQPVTRAPHIKPDPRPKRPDSPAPLSPPPPTDRQTDRHPTAAMKPRTIPSAWLLLLATCAVFGANGEFPVVVVFNSAKVQVEGSRAARRARAPFPFADR